METATEPRPALSPTVRALGIVSMFADVSSEMVYPINPVFITRVLGAPPWALGLIEGIAESTASLLKLVSGWMSDRFGARKPFAVGGYAAGALGKPIVGTAQGWGQVLLGRFVDRVGKGLRTAPRDALIAENVDAANRGRAFGFHRSMDTAGAVLGPLIGFLFLRYVVHAESVSGFRALYWLAFIPGVVSALVIAVFVRERRAPITEHRAPAVSRSPGLPVSLSGSYRRYLAIVALFSLGNSSDTFLLLRARDMGLRPEWLLLVYAVFNVVEASLGYAAGALSDRVPRRYLIATGYGVFALVYLGFALLNGPTAVWALFPVYGLYYTLTQGVQRALAADLAHPDRRGAELGAFHMVVGLAALPASFAAGWLYEWRQPAPFILGAVCATTAAALLLAVRLDRPTPAPAANG